MYVKHLSAGGAVFATLFAVPLVGASSALAAGNNVVVTTITAAHIDPNNVLPNFDLAPKYAGAGIGSWDTGYPLAVLQHGSFYNISMTLRVTNFTGICRATYQITRGSTVLDSGVLNKKWECATGDLWGWTLNSHAIPNLPGPATLTGTVAYGRQTATMSVPIVIQ